MPTAPTDDFSDEDLSSEKTGASISDDIVCPTCGYCNDGVAFSCVECGRPLDQVHHRPNLAGVAAEFGTDTSQVAPPSLSSKNKATVDVGGAATANNGGSSVKWWPPLVTRARWFKWAVFATLLLNVALFLVWLLTTDHGLPWFIYPLAASVIFCGCLHLASHNVEDPWFRFHVLVSATVNFTLMFTYVFAFSRQPYFAYVLLPSAGLLCLHCLLTDRWGPQPRPHKYFYVHLLSIFVPLNLILFTVFLTTQPTEAWFVFPLLLTSVPLLNHYTIAFHPEDPHKWFYVNLITVSCLAGHFFLLWAVTPTDHPWFVYLWLAGGVLIAGHYIYDYHPKAILTGATQALGLAQLAWTKLHNLRAPSWRKKADQPPPVVTPEAAGMSSPTPMSQV
jgi:hypothetical protein